MERRGRGIWIGALALALVVVIATLPGRVCLPLQAHAQNAPAPAVNPPDMHSISVVFDYDFGKNPSCEEKPALKKCVKQFVVYDISVGRSRLFAIAVPSGARGAVKGVKGQSPKRAYLPGRHLLAVTAQNADGEESQAATIVVDIIPKVPSPASK